MIQFFKKIRKNLLNENRLSKYFIYAFGEIFIVMISILLALQLNNWNENRSNIVKADQLLKNVHEELALNIKKSNRVISYYRQRDTLIYNVYHGKVTIEDYKSNSRLFTLIQSYSVADLQDNAVIELTKYNATLSSHQDSFFTTIIKFNNINKSDVDAFDKRMGDFIYKYIEQLSDEMAWFNSDLRMKNLPKELYDYYLSNPFYLNKVMIYNTIAMQNLIGNVYVYKFRALELYIKLSEYLNIPSDSSIVRNTEEYKHYLGTYLSKDFTISIKQEKDKLFYNKINNVDSTVVVSYPFYPESDIQFVDFPRFGRLTKNRDGEIIGIVSTLGISQQIEYTKVKKGKPVKVKSSN